MLKKRMVFTLLWNEGRYCLSRNFRLQHVGDRKWLEENYDFATVASSVDELCMLDVSDQCGSQMDSLGMFMAGIASFQMPLSVGGGVYSIDAARSVLRAGADKVIVNSGFFMRRPPSARSGTYSVSSASSDHWTCVHRTAVSGVLQQRRAKSRVTQGCPGFAGSGHDG